LFQRIKPKHDEWLENIENSNSVRESKIAQKKYNLQRAIVREDHWKILRQKYFEENEVSDGCKSDGCTLKVAPEYKSLYSTERPVDDASKKSDGRKLKVRDEYKSLFVAECPVDDESNKSNWRQIVVVRGCTLQLLLVVIALVSGIYSYLAVAQDIETEVAVQDGLGVLKNVSKTAWAVFVLFNLVVIIYYSNSCWNSLISGYRTVKAMVLILFTCCVNRRNLKLETAFKPTWACRYSTDTSKSYEYSTDSGRKSSELNEGSSTVV